MRAYFVRRVDGKLEVEARQISIPTPKPGERLIRVASSSLNRGELLLATEQWKAAGAELAGEDPATGERLMGRCRGGFAEYAILDEWEALPIPSRLSFAQAAAIPLTFLVAYDILCVESGLRAQEWLAIVGVASGVGVSCLVLGKHLGARIAGTSRSEQKLERLASLGLDLPLHGPDWSSEMQRKTAGQGAQVVVNAVGGSQFVASLSALGYQGRLAVVGSADRVLSVPIDLALLHEKRLRVFGVSNRLRSAAERAQTVAGFRREILPTIDSGSVIPVIDRTYHFDELPQALAAFDSGAHCGKIVLTW